MEFHSVPKSIITPLQYKTSPLMSPSCSTKCHTRKHVHASSSGLDLFLVQQGSYYLVREINPISNFQILEQFDNIFRRQRGLLDSSLMIWRELLQPRSLWVNWSTYKLQFVFGFCEAFFILGKTHPLTHGFYKNIHFSNIFLLYARVINKLFWVLTTRKLIFLEWWKLSLFFSW